MNRPKLDTLAKYVLAIVAGLGLAFLYISLRDFSEAPPLEKYRMLCDAFTIPGVMMLAIGALVAVANEGIFYGIGYALSYLGRALTFRGSKQERYYDYVERKRAKHVSGYGFLFIVGAGFMAIALIFLILFYRLYN